MKYPLNAINIHHFRSIRDCTLSDLRQINVLIGRPNTGKTNIIDAVTLFAIPELATPAPSHLKYMLRAQTPEDLFYMKSATQYASVTSNRAECLLQYSETEGMQAKLAFDTSRHEQVYHFDTSLELKSSTRTDVDPVIKRYNFHEYVSHSGVGGPALTSPYGSNLFRNLVERPNVQQQIAEIFAGTGINIHFDEYGPKMLIPNDAGAPTDLRFLSLSSSLQRMCFYLAAIGSNGEKLIVIDNLDANIFPTKLIHLAAGMLENKNTQYLFSTHHYYMLIDLLEDGFDNVAIFNVYLENQETKIYRLTDHDLHAIVYNGLDPFINNDVLQPSRQRCK